MCYKNGVFPLGAIFEVLVYIYKKNKTKRNTSFVHDVTWITAVFLVLFGNTSPFNPIMTLRERLEVELMMVAVSERV